MELVWCFEIWYTRSIPSGKHTKNYGKPPFSMGKSTLSLSISLFIYKWQFSIAMLVYQRVFKKCCVMFWAPMKTSRRHELEEERSRNNMSSDRNPCWFMLIVFFLFYPLHGGLHIVHCGNPDQPSSVKKCFMTLLVLSVQNTAHMNISFPLLW